MENEAAKEQAVAIGRARSLATVQRTITSMPIVLSYVAHIEAVQAREIQGETTFFGRHAKENADGAVAHHWDEEQRDPHQVRAEFEQIRTQRQALDFLRHNGDFSPLENYFSWSTFQRWQRFIAIVRDPATMAEAFLHPSASADVKDVMKALAGYPHNFFPPIPAPASAEEEQIRKAGLGEAVRRGVLARQEAQEKLERWFIKPPLEIFWQPRITDEAVLLRLSAGGAVPELVLSQEEIEPVLLIRANHILTAIAASIYADRVSETRFRICPICSVRFEISGPTDKRLFDTPRCRETAKKRRDRNKARQGLV